ncbi:MAG TPA: hypothetical protein PLW68_01535 [Casimicrobiaceae bacterium]|nr:hypothetical protein [Casimicrobiaceae bacterium]
MSATSTTRAGPFPDLSIDDFLYGHEGPWPQPSRDHPFGQAPGIYQIPKEEWDDWSKYVGNYYLEKAASFGVKSAEIAVHDSRQTALEYAEITDADFNTVVCEGLYSKFLSDLDPRDRVAFKDFITDADRFDYLKSDYSCMRVVRETHPGEAAAASVALVRRPRNDTGFNYEVVAIKLQHWDKKARSFVESPVFTSGDGEAWRIARYFLLQGAIHRINLIDHTEVHFPPDAINAITKTVLPKDNLVLRLLRPHMWLSMCVNNTVLEGQRSLINRNTWYPWSPFVAQGDEVRKLLPFGWYGSEYYSARLSPGDPSKDAYFDESNSSYPAYRWDPDPPKIPSRYGEFLNSYFAPIRKFTRGVVDQMSETDWKEIRYWADHIRIWIPGFPSGDELLGAGADGAAPNKDLLADTLAHFIWNASVRHSADHQTLHEMMDGRRDANGKLVAPGPPVPFIMRVEPPMTKDYKLTPAPVETSGLHFSEKLEELWDHLTRKTPLCWPTDLLHAHWADLLFYMPHNSRRLMDLTASMDGDRNQNYAFDTPALKGLVDQFQSDLRALDASLAKDPSLHFVPLADIASSIQY